MRRRAAFASVVALGLVWAVLAKADTAPDPLAQIAGFHAWYRANPERYKIAPAVNVLCAAPVGPHETVPKNPHENAFVDVYVNETGRAAMEAGGASVYPEGSIIVKEKRKAIDDAEPTLLTVMIKRAKGFNPEVGDWEFAVLDGEGTKIEAMGRLENCMACHRTVAGSDFVYRTYVPKSS